MDVAGISLNIVIIFLSFMLTGGLSPCEQIFFIKMSQSTEVNPESWTN